MQLYCLSQKIKTKVAELYFYRAEKITATPTPTEYKENKAKVHFCLKVH